MSDRQYAINLMVQVAMAHSIPEARLAAAIRWLLSTLLM